MKPTLFNQDMVRAILDGRKTVTRRVVRPQPETADDIIYKNQECGEWFISPDNDCFPEIEVKPPYRPGDILYVPEAWKCSGTFGEQGYEVEFRDGQHIKFQFEYRGRAKKWGKYRDKPSHQWQSPYFMPREAARLLLRVTDVRVERLQNIDGLGAFDEGAVAEMPAACLPPQKPAYFDRWSADKQNDYLRAMATSTYIAKLEFADRLVKSFAALWNSTIPKVKIQAYGWNANPWVWVIPFERISKEEAQKGGVSGG